MEWIILLGIVTGMRTMTAIAVLCWATHLGYIPLQGTWAFWMGNIVSAIVFTMFALGEYVGDTLPRTPNRTSLMPLLARLVFSAVVTTAAMTALQEPVAGGILFGLVGGLIGSYGGQALRAALARFAGRDLPVALLESASALALAILATRELYLSATFMGRH